MNNKKKPALEELQSRLDKIIEVCEYHNGKADYFKHIKKIALGEK
jgi:hypothetical protein